MKFLVAAIQKSILALIRLYRSTAALRQPVCRFTPSCSEYAEEAISRHGIIRGNILLINRLLRCHPFCAHGFDPVPLSFRAKRSNP